MDNIEREAAAKALEAESRAYWDAKYPKAAARRAAREAAAQRRKAAGKPPRKKRNSQKRAVMRPGSDSLNSADRMTAHAHYMAAESEARLRAYKFIKWSAETAQRSGAEAAESNRIRASEAGAVAIIRWRRGAEAKRLKALEDAEAATDISDIL